MWYYHWPPNITHALVSETNPGGTLNNSDLELTALVLHEAILLSALPEASMADPQSGLDNNPTIYWSTC